MGTSDDQLARDLSFHVGEVQRILDLAEGRGLHAHLYVNEMVENHRMERCLLDVILLRPLKMVDR